jgi:hypothetical protein
VSPNDLPPEPLLESVVDLRDFAFMPVDVRRLLTSETWVLGTPAEKVAALNLWLEAWHQVPAGSLPNNERMLAHLSQAGAGWKKVAAHAMRGWVLCSDGRWYHAVIVEKALEGWERKQKQRDRSRKGNAKRWGLNDSADALAILEGHEDRSLKESHKDSPNDPKGQGQGQGQGQGDLNTRSHLTQGRGDPPKTVRSPTGSRLAPDWTLPEDLKAWATEARPDLDIALQAARFRDYWAALPGAKGRKTDWPATWRNWIRGEKLAPGTYARPAYDYEAIARAAGLTDDDEEHAHATD